MLLYVNILFTSYNMKIEITCVIFYPIKSLIIEINPSRILINEVGFQKEITFTRF